MHNENDTGLITRLPPFNKLIYNGNKYANSLINGDKHFATACNAVASLFKKINSLTYIHLPIREIIKTGNSIIFA